MKTHRNRTFFAALLLLAVCLAAPVSVHAAKKGTTVYKGVNYKRVYNYSYYMKHYPKVKKLTGGDPKKAIRYFVTKGMKRQHQAIATFNVRSYRYGNPSLRKKYHLNYRKYYLHYMKKGYKTSRGKETATGIQKLVKPATVYKGKDYSSVYNYSYYRSHNSDVRKKYKDDDYAILKHYVTKGRKEGRAGNAAEAARLAKSGTDDGDSSSEEGTSQGGSSPGSATSPSQIDEDSFVITSCKISGKNVKVTALNTVGNGTKVYLFAVPTYAKSLKSYSPKASAVVKGTTVSIETPLKMNQKGSVLQCKFYIAVKSGKNYKVASNYYYIQNPEAASSNRKAFPKAKRGTKKGLKTIIADDSYIQKAIDLKCSHVIADFPLEGFLNGSDLAYEYEGKIYYFSSSILAYREKLKKLRKNGIVVTGVFYLADKSMTRYMLPSAAAADKSQSTTFSLNTDNKNRKTLEALFSCIGHYFTTGGALMGNFVFGNESNNRRTYCFSGQIGYASYIRHYCESYRMFNTAIKSQYRNARVYISLDHNWNLSFDLEGSYNAGSFLKAVAKKFSETGDIHFDLALHPYPSPEQDPRFWIRSRLVSDAADTQQYTMYNMDVMASYLKNTYGKNVHIILPETGINSKYQGREMQEYQAASIAYSYYLTEFNPDIDMIGIHREMDDPSEAVIGFYVGLYGSSFRSPKMASKVFKYMDTKRWNRYTQKYLKYIRKGATWRSLVKGFYAGRFS